MIRHEAARLRHDADLAAKEHEEAVARKLQAEIDVARTSREVTRTRELAARAEAAARKAPGGILGDPSTVGAERYLQARMGCLLKSLHW
jgi:hypothetical protein